MLALVPRPLPWLVLAVALFAACSGDDDADDTAATTTVGTESTLVQATAQPASTEAPSATAVATTPAAGAATTTPTTLPAAVLPGADSDDPACRAAGDFFSSLNALVYPLSTSFLDEPPAALDYATLEVVAAPSLLASGGALEASWPAAAAGELADVKSGFLDPFIARQQAAVSALTAAGVTPAEQEDLQEAWQAVVTSGGTSTEVSNLRPQDLGIDGDLATKVGQAGEAFLAAQGPILESGVFGNLVTYPQLEQYLTEACPDVAEIVAANF
jgi:hypothetical protein